MQVAIEIPDIDHMVSRINTMERRIAQLEAMLETQESAPEFLKRKDFMKAYSITKDKFYDLLHEGKLQSVQIGPRTVVYKAKFKIQ